MNTEALKINLAQRILSIGDYSILEKVNQLLNKNNIIGYNTNGNPIFESEYIQDIEDINRSIDNNSAILFSSEEIKKIITDENSLVR